MSRLVELFHLLKLTGSLLLIHYVGIGQNLVSNPDFGLVEVQYATRKLVRPVGWYAFEGKKPSFIHPAKKDGEFPPKLQRNVRGIIGIGALHPSSGIFTKLKQPLAPGTKYTMCIDLEKHYLVLNSDWLRVGSRITSADGTPIPPSKLDYNHNIALVMFFSNELPTCTMTKPKRYVVIDIPDEAHMPMSIVRTLNAEYTATGDEVYFGIGLCNETEYLRVLKQHNPSDTTNYTRKWAAYYFHNVYIAPVPVPITCFNVSFASKKATLELRTGARFTMQNLNFDHNSSTLTEGAREELSSFAMLLKQNSAYSVVIEGHTDTVGTAEYNQKLSERRAKTVYSYLISSGIASSRLSYVGKGEQFPLDSSGVALNMGVNRRVEFELMEMK